MNALVLDQLAVGPLALGDPTASRTVYAVVAALIGIGLALLVIAVWVIRSTRPERELLAPLERMNDRSWRKQDPAQRRRTLDEVRPDGANPIAPEPKRPVLDAEFAQSVPTLGSFDDLQAQERSYASNMASEFEPKSFEPESDGTDRDESGPEETVEEPDESVEQPIEAVEESIEVGSTDDELVIDDHGQGPCV